jgi:hypothetical protein
MKATAEHDIAIGGPTLAAHAINAGLVDEYQLFVNPVVVGGGKSYLPDNAHLGLEKRTTAPEYSMSGWRLTWTRSEPTSPHGPRRAWSFSEARIWGLRMFRTMVHAFRFKPVGLHPSPVTSGDPCAWSTSTTRCSISGRERRGATSWCLPHCAQIQRTWQCVRVGWLWSSGRAIVLGLLRQGSTIREMTRVRSSRLASSGGCLTAQP